MVIVVTREVILKGLEVVVGKSKLGLISRLWIKVGVVLEVDNSVTVETAKRRLTS